MGRREAMAVTPELYWFLVGVVAGGVAILFVKLG